MIAAVRDGAPHEFRAQDFVGGHPVTDFVNTVTARNAMPVDWLDSYPTFLNWASLSALANRVDLALAQLVQPGADAELRRCRDLREALHAVLTAVIDEHPVPQPAAATLQANWRLAAAHARLDFSTSPLHLQYGRQGPSLTVVRRALSAATVELLTGLRRDRLRRCPGQRCGWIFIDTSKAGRRRWCDMATCGTADKNRRRQPIHHDPHREPEDQAREA